MKNQVFKLVLVHHIGTAIALISHNPLDSTLTFAVLQSSDFTCSSKRFTGIILNCMQRT